MTKSIRTYKELIEEKERLEALMKAQRELIRLDIQELKTEMKPVFGAVRFVSKLTSRDKSNPLLGSAAGTIVDLVLRKLLLARAGWFTKLIVPLITKNVSSHYIAENKNKWIKKLATLLGHKNGKSRKVDTKGVPDPSAPAATP